MRWDAVLHPVGSLPEATYWLRRALVLGACIVLVIVLALLTSAIGGSGGSPKAGAGIHLPTPSLSSASAPPTTAVPTLGQATIAECADHDLGVSITTGAPSYPAGSLPQFVVTVTNTGASPCKRDLGAKATVITVMSGSDRIWSSGDCPSTKTDVSTLAPDKATPLRSSWNRERSVPGCTTTGAAGETAKTGVYVASVKLGTLAAPGMAPFHLS